MATSAISQQELESWLWGAADILRGPGDRKVRLELRKILDDNGLPPVGELFDRTYAYVRANY